MLAGAMSGDPGKNSAYHTLIHLSLAGYGISPPLIGSYLGK
jgi:hypothetical protein